MRHVLGAQSVLLVVCPLLLIVGLVGMTYALTGDELGIWPALAVAGATLTALGYALRNATIIELEEKP